MLKNGLLKGKRILVTGGGTGLGTGGNFYAYRSYDDSGWANVRESIRLQDNKDKLRRSA